MISLIPLLATIGLCLGMLLACELGRRTAATTIARNPDGLSKGTGAAEAAVFALLGLLVAFSFSGAASRFEDRRHLITAEANAIGTAYLRVDLLPADAQPELRTLFREYARVRAVVYEDASDAAATKARADRATALQGMIWNKAVTAFADPATSGQAIMLLTNALNEMIDITTTRAMATRNHPPLVVFALLGVLSLIGSFLIGHSVAAAGPGRSWLQTSIFALVLPLTVYVIVELELPRIGLVVVNSADTVVGELPEFKQAPP